MSHKPEAVHVILERCPLDTYIISVHATYEGALRRIKEFAEKRPGYEDIGGGATWSNKANGKILSINSKYLLD